MKAAAEGHEHPISRITKAILQMRGCRVLLDKDLADLYGVETKRLNEQVRRNLQRFPRDFVFEVTDAELENLKSQTATSSWGGRRKRPLVFTEHGAIMAATILNSPQAVAMTIHVVRAFVHLREVLASGDELSQKLRELETRVSHHDQAISGIIKTIRQLVAPKEPSSRPIGFVPLEEKKRVASSTPKK